MEDPHFKQGNGKRKGVGMNPTPNYYQTVVAEVLHSIMITGSNF